MNKKPFIRLVVATIVLIVVIGIYGLCYAMVTAESVQAATLAAQILQQRNATTESAQAKSELAELTSQQETINQYFVSTNDVVPFIDQLQSIGNSVGANVQVASVAATPGVPYGELTLSLNITGSFESVMRTIGSIEYEPYNTSVSSLTFASVPSDNTASSSPQWTAAMTFAVGALTGGATAPTSPTSPSSVSQSATTSSATTPTTQVPATIPVGTFATSTSSTTTVPTGPTLGT